MVRIPCAYSLSDVAAIVGTPLPVSHDALEPEPPTKRLTDADLARVVATMNDPHATSDDDLAVVTVAPQIPAGTPSPLGDDVAHDLEEAFSLLLKHGEAAAAADVTEA